MPKMRSVIQSITLAAWLLSSAAASDDKAFTVGPVTGYAHQESEKVTVGAKLYDNEELTTSAFGKKADLLKFGVLPVLVVLQNKRDKALDLTAMEVGLVATDGRHANAVNPDDLPFLASSGKHPSQTGVHVNLPVPLPKKKNPLNAPEISTRAFAAKVVAPGDSASGFFYFEAKSEPGDKLFLQGLKDARTGQELLYFEFPMGK